MLEAVPSALISAAVYVVASKPKVPQVPLLSPPRAVVLSHVDESIRPMRNMESFGAAELMPAAM
ncbi:hypothetical protein FQZ97_1122920 [compost metagenome]